jgi:hypothetical protein
VGVAPKNVVFNGKVIKFIRINFFTKYSHPHEEEKEGKKLVRANNGKVILRKFCAGEICFRLLKR